MLGAGAPAETAHSGGVDVLVVCAQDALDEIEAPQPGAVLAPFTLEAVLELTLVPPVSDVERSALGAVGVRVTKDQLVEVQFAVQRTGSPS